MMESNERAEPSCGNPLHVRCPCFTAGMEYGIEQCSGSTSLDAEVAELRGWVAELQKALAIARKETK